MLYDVIDEDVHNGKEFGFMDLNFFPFNGVFYNDENFHSREKFLEYKDP